MRFDESANGSVVEIPTREEFELALSETRTAGFVWAFKNSVQPVCLLLDESFHPASGKTGGRGTHSWRFRAVAPGECSLTLEYKRSWETSTGPARTFGMKVRVRR